MNRLLTPRRLKDNEDFIWGAANAQIDEFIESGRCEFLTAYAQPFALSVIADLLGIPPGDHSRLRQEVKAAGQPGALGQPLSLNPLSSSTNGSSGT